MNLDDLLSDVTELTVQSEVDFYSPKISDDNLYGRCLYLLDDLKIQLPVFLQIKIPYYNELQKSKALWSPLVTEHYRKGKSFGKGSTEELKEILDELLWKELKDYSERQRFIGYVESLSNGLFETNDERKFSDLKSGTIEKFDSGFQPIDKALKGFYQGIFCFAGLPGAGKTSILLSLAASFAQNYPVWYFQTEIPSDLIQPRFQLLNPESFHTDSMFHAGNYSSASILEKILKNPNKNRIIIYDSPEIMNSSEPIVYWEKTMQDFVQIKQHSKCVLFTSQIQQKQSWEELNVYSLSGSANKGRYADGIIYLNQFAGNLMIKTAKNRFGHLGNSITKYNYETLKIEEDFISDLFS